MCKYCEEKKFLPFKKMWTTDDEQNGYIAICKQENNIHTIDFALYIPDITRMVIIKYCPICGKNLKED